MQTPFLFFYPAAAMIFYIFVLGISNFYVRVRGTKNGSIPPKYFKNLDSKTYPVPEFVTRMGRHYDHQFQLPLLFLIICLAYIALHIFHPVAWVAAWCFVGSRMLHTYVHLGSNHVLRRVLAFQAGWVCVNVLWVLIVVHLLSH